MRGDGYDKYRISPAGAEAPTSLKERILARRTPILVAALLIGGLAFAAGWNPPTTTVHSFTEQSDYNARRESGCTNSGDGCHGTDEDRRDFNLYHPDSKCTTCHDYQGVGCIPCHAPRQKECTGCHDGSMEGVSDCVRLTDSFPKGHYRDSLHEATGTDMKAVVLSAEGGEAKATCGDCHSRDLRQAHTGVPEVEGSEYGTEVGCAECHNDKPSGALEQVLSKWEEHRCENCHGEKSRAPMHDTTIASAIEATGDSGCSATGEGCHNVNDLHALHPDAPATCSGSAGEGEPGCHDLNLQSQEPTITACGAGDGTCHAGHKTDGYGHENDEDVHTATAQGSVLLTEALSGVSITCSSCHKMEITAEHSRSHVTLSGNVCVSCHNENDATLAAVSDSWPARQTTQACATCHEGMHAGISEAHIATNNGCLKAGCHATADVRILHKGKGCTLSGCHSNSDRIAGYRMTCGGTGANSCHTGTDLNAIHAYPHGNASGTVSSACTSCHGATVMTSSPTHDGCSCHYKAAAGPGDVRSAIASGAGECADCHQKSHAAHGFEQTAAESAASGHNTTTYGRVGAYSKFDGSQGPVVLWESEIASATLQPTWLVEAGFQNATRPDGITSVTVGQTGRVTTDWPFPTVNVFWRPGDTNAPEDAMFLNKDSVVTCQDCHSGLSAAGPHGADQHWGIDPDYPADYSYAELTKRVEQFPSGIKLRRSLTYNASADPVTGYDSGMTVICSKCHDLQNYQSGTTVNNPLPRTSTGDASFTHDGETYNPVYLDMASTRNDGYYVWTDNSGHQIPAADISVAGVAGSQTWSSTNPQAQAWMQGAAGTLTATTIGSSNTAHSSHHQDNVDGSAQCVNCHIGVPHGWKRPRLLVNTGWDGSANSIGAGVVAGDEEPYRDPDVLGVSRNAGGIRIGPNGFNGMGMLTLSAVDNHGLWAGSQVNVRYDTGAAYWSEPSCQACNDHAGEDGIRIINFEE
jgi:hypothetical protein